MHHFSNTAEWLNVGRINEWGLQTAPSKSPRKEDSCVSPHLNFSGGVPLLMVPEQQGHIGRVFHAVWKFYYQLWPWVCSPEPRSTVLKWEIIKQTPNCNNYPIKIKIPDAALLSTLQEKSALKYQFSCKVKLNQTFLNFIHDSRWLNWKEWIKATNKNLLRVL